VDLELQQLKHLTELVLRNVGIEAKVTIDETNGSVDIEEHSISITRSTRTVQALGRTAEVPCWVVYVLGEPLTKECCMAFAIESAVAEICDQRISEAVENVKDRLLQR